MNNQDITIENRLKIINFIKDSIIYKLEDFNNIFSFDFKFYDSNKIFSTKDCFEDISFYFSFFKVLSDYSFFNYEMKNYFDNELNQNIISTSLNIIYYNYSSTSVEVISLSNEITNNSHDDKCAILENELSRLILKLNNNKIYTITLLKLFLDKLNEAKENEKKLNQNKKDEY